MLISIISINFNNFHGLKKTIKSVIELNFNDYEYIVIDGNSTDNSRDLIVNSCAVDKYLIEKDIGIYDAMNKGARLASGRFLYFLNSGDVVCPDIFSKLYEIKDVFNYDVIYGSTKSFSSDVIDLSRKVDVILYDIPFCHQSVLMKREVFMKFKFSYKYKLAADYHLFLQVYLTGYRFYQTDLIFSTIDTTGVSHTRQLEVIREYVNIIFAVHYFAKSCLIFSLFLVKKHRFILRVILKKFIQ